MSDRSLLVRSLGAVLAALLFFVLIPMDGAVAQPSEVSAADDAAQPFIVKIHADWCGACVKLNSTFESLHQKLGSGARLVVLDVTDEQTLTRATAEAERLGIREFFDRHKSKTGTVGVLHGATREPIRVMRGETDVAKYEAAVAQAVAGRAS